MKNFFKDKYKLLLVAIVLLGLTLRFYQLGTTPALNADEAALGYNAYSLLQTGKDEHGNPWPIHFQSFNDWKPGLTVYLILPSVYLFGLSEWSVRFIPALLSVGTIISLYALVALLFKDKRFALLSALFLAISPWHIHFSRGAWEVNVATFFIVTGVAIFMASRAKTKLLVVSGIMFVLSMYAYHSARVISPLLGLGLFATHFTFLRKNLRIAIVALIVALVCALPLAIDLVKPEALSRAAGVGLFADPGPRSRIEEQRGEHINYQALLPKLLHNKATNYGLAFFDNWVAHFHGEFLFLSGDEIQRNKVPETGQMYMIDFLFIGSAVVFLSQRLFSKKESSRSWLVILWWLVVVPTAAALTFQAPHSLRAANLSIPLVVLSAYGVIQLIINIKYKRVGIFILGLVLVVSVGRYLLMYYGHMAKEYPFSSQYGVRQLVDFVQDKNANYEKVIVTDRYDQPYILFLFFLKYPPEQFQNEGKLTDRDGFGFSTVRKFSNFEFRSIKYDEDRPLFPNSLIVGTPGEIPQEANITKDIYDSNGYLYFRIVAN